MSGLTQEQLQRIRENKRKAQERLARKRPLPQASSTDLPPFKQPPIKPSFYSSTASKPPVKKPPSDKVLFKKMITASFILKDASHFKVIAPYDSTLVDLFKTIKSRSYGKCGPIFNNYLLFLDASTQVWSFALQDYQKLSG